MATTDYDYALNTLIARSIEPTAEIVALLAHRVAAAAQALAAMDSHTAPGKYEAAVATLEREVDVLAEAAASAKRMAASLDGGAF